MKGWERESEWVIEWMSEWMKKMDKLQFGYFQVRIPINEVLRVQQERDFLYRQRDEI
jgi:hypothetical protein